MRRSSITPIGSGVALLVTVAAAGAVPYQQPVRLKYGPALHAYRVRLVADTCCDIAHPQPRSGSVRITLRTVRILSANPQYTSGAVCWSFSPLHGIGHATHGWLVALPYGGEVDFDGMRGLKYRGCQPVHMQLVRMIGRDPHQYGIEVTSTLYPNAALKGTL